MNDSTPNDLELFLKNGGECGELIRSINWDETSLGKPAQWPASLKTALNIILNSRFPMFIWWGPELLCFYNDAYRPSLGNEGKHPTIMGKPAAEAWSEIWDIIKPLIDFVLEGKGSTWSEDQLIPIYRNGKMEDVYWTFSYSPISDEYGKIKGVLVTCNETTEKVLAYKRLEESNKRYLNNILQAPVAMAVLRGPDFSIEVANALMLQLWEKTAEEVIHTSFLDILSNEAVHYKDELRQVYLTGKKFEGSEVPFSLHKDNEVVYLNFVYEAFREPDGHISGIVVTATNVTELVLSKQKVQENSRRFQDLILQAPMGIVVLRGHQFVVETVNDAYLELIDRKRDAFEGISIFESVPELKGQAVELLLNKVLSTGEPIYGNEFKAILIRDHKEEDCYFNFVYQPLTEGEKTTGIMVVAMEVTQLVNAKYSLQESEAQFRKLVMQSPIPMTLFRGPNHIIEMANRVMFEDIWRKKETEIIGKPILEVFPELNDQKYPELLKKVYESGISHSEKESIAYIQGDDGLRKFYFDFEYSPLKEKDGSISGILITVNDVTERVEARESIKESESYFRMMADSVPVMIWITTREGKCSYVNKQWNDYTGLSIEKSINYGWLSAIHPDDQENAKQIFEESQRKNIPFQIEYRLYNEETDYYFWTLAVGFPRFDAQNQFDGYIGTVTDINDRKIAEERLKESEEKSLLAIDAAELGTYEWEIGSDMVYASERFAQIFDVPENDFIPRRQLIDKFHPEDLHIHQEAHARVEKTGVLSYEARLVDKAGNIRWIKIKGNVVKDLFGSSSRKMLGTVMDITEIKHIESALKNSEARLSEAQRIASIGNWEYNYVDKSFYCSDEAYRILSAHPNRFVPNFYSLFKIVHAEDLKKIRRVLSFTRKTGLPFNVDFRIITDEQKIKYINSQGYVMMNGDQIEKIIGTLQDITMRKLVEEELIEAKRISEKSLRYKDQFLANMSHEIRTPMNAIIGFTELTLKTQLQQEQRQYIDAIKTSGENLLVIINDILDFSKLEAGAIHFERVNFKLQEVISTLTDLMLPKSVEKGIKLSVSIDHELPDQLLGDPTRLNQILLNLVGNAIKFTEKGEIKISVKPLWQLENELEIAFSVADTGIGIDPTMTETIFEVFTQTSSDTTRKYGGSGLGLAIVKQFVERQGGKIWVETELGHGSTFHFTLQFGIATEQEKEAESEQELLPEIKTDSIRVLLVEDNKLNQLLASKAMSNWDWEVEIAENGLIAIEKIAQQEFDVVLMDIQLPEMDGYEATRLIRSRFEFPKSNTPIIAVTAHAMQSEIKKCKDAGMDGYITKPFSPKMLYEGVVQVLNKQTHLAKDA